MKKITIYRCLYCPMASLDRMMPVMFHVELHHPGKMIPSAQDLEEAAEIIEGRRPDAS